MKYYFYDCNTAIIIGQNHMKNSASVFINKLVIRLLNPKFLHLHSSHLSQKLIDWTHKNDIQVNIYTINSQPKLDLCIHLNVDGIFTDNHNFYKK